MISDTIVRQRVRRPSRRKWYVRPWQRAYPGVEALVCPVLAQKLTHILEIPEETDNQEGSCLKPWLVPFRKFHRRVATRCMSWESPGATDETMLSEMHQRQ